MANLPKLLHILDIETLKTSRKNLLDSEIAFAGLKTYKKVAKGKYRSIGYKYFLPNELKKLQDILENASGIIIGHNLFDFDYRVLSKYINISPAIIRKSIDTLYFLYRKNSHDYRGCGLDRLAKLNIGLEKTLNSRKVGSFWLRGYQRKVIQYNKHDCSLTFRIYTHMLRKKYIYYLRYKREYDWPAYPEKVDITKKDLLLLTGKRKMISFKQWNSLSKSNSRLMQVKFGPPIINLQGEVIEFPTRRIHYLALRVIHNHVRVANEKYKRGVLKIQPLPSDGKWKRVSTLEEFLRPEVVDGFCEAWFKQDKKIIATAFKNDKPFPREGWIYITRSGLLKALQLGLKICNPKYMSYLPKVWPKHGFLIGFIYIKHD